MNTEIDIRHVLPTVHVPTVIIHRTDDLDIEVGNGRYLAERIDGARYVELQGNDHLLFAGNQEDILGEIEQFLTGVRRDQSDEIDRVLATVLIAQIVNAGETAARLGDERWSDLRDRHDRVVDELCGKYRAGRSARTLDGLMATFDGPARAVRCARELIEGGRGLGLSIRVGLHTGEVVESGNVVVGVAVHLADRIAERASPGSVLVSNTVKDLVAGSGLEFDPIGQQVFPGLPGEWRLFTVADGSPSARQPPAAISATSRLAILSPREREVAERLALGLSNRQIADELFISPATAERHVANILVKLGFHSRTQIAAWAVEQGILRTPLEPS
jgi:class 3 adenylate cyclase